MGVHSRYTIPNLVTGLRIAMALAAAWIALAASPVVAVAVLIAAALLDVVDGWYARTFSQRSAFGAHMDPLADKILMGVVFVWIGIAADSAWVWVPLGLVAAREGGLTLLRAHSLRRCGRFIPASRFGKAKMFTQSIVGLSTLSVMHFLGREVPVAVMAAGMWLTVAVCYASGAGYLARWRGDEARRREYAVRAVREPAARASAGR